METGDTVIPASLHDPLVARLDRLPGVKEIAQTAGGVKELPWGKSTILPPAGASGLPATASSPMTITAAGSRSAETCVGN